MNQSFTVLVGKGTRGKFRPVLNVKGEGFARLTAAMVPSGFRAKVEPRN